MTFNQGIKYLTKRRHCEKGHKNDKAAQIIQYKTRQVSHNVCNGWLTVFTGGSSFLLHTFFPFILLYLNPVRMVKWHLARHSVYVIQQGNIWLDSYIDFGFSVELWRFLKFLVAHIFLVLAAIFHV